MIDSEVYLVEAVRDRLIAECGYGERQCQVEHDEQLDAVAGDLAVVVMPAGARPDNVHDTCGGVDDWVFSVAVLVAMRITAVPRDRTRKVYVDRLTGLNKHLMQIHNAVDWKYAVNDLANAAILLNTGSSAGFIEPLRFVGVDAKPRIVGGEMFAGTGERAALVRTITFGGARRIRSK